MSLSGAERAMWWLNRVHSFNLLRYNAIRARNPAASESELIALWTEETYRDTVDPAFLARACAAIRARGERAP